MVYTRSKSTIKVRNKLDRALIPCDTDREAMGLCYDLACVKCKNSFLQKVGLVKKGKSSNLKFRHKDRRNRCEQQWNEHHASVEGVTASRIEAHAKV